jgi:hypothetical protein
MTLAAPIKMLRFLGYFLLILFAVMTPCDRGQATSYEAP